MQATIIKQEKIQEIENDVITTENSRIQCKILQVTTTAIIFLWRGHKQGLPLRKVEYFRYGD